MSIGQGMVRGQCMVTARSTVMDTTPRKGTVVEDIANTVNMADIGGMAICPGNWKPRAQNQEERRHGGTRTRTPGA